jgi:hypothetical protein
MKLVHLKMDSPQNLAMPSIAQELMYPYGCCLHLTQEILEALGFEELPPAGSTFKVEGIGVVTSASTEDPDADGDVDMANVRIQMTHLAIEQDSDKNRAAARKSKAAKLYGGDTDKDSA